MLLIYYISTEARTYESYIILMRSQSQLASGTLTCGLGLRQHSFPFTPDLINTLVATESERDLSIRKESPEHLLDTLLATQGKSVHVRTPHYHQDECRRASVVSYFRT